MSDVSRETDDRPELDLPWVLALDPYARLLQELGVERGLIGPRELPRLWERHLLNCAVVALDESLVPRGATVIDVGSGAGLPGLVWALVRPDLQVTCLDSLLRRTDFLALAVDRLGLADRVRVVRGRAEEQAIVADVVTARAVAPLERLAGWTLPLTRVGGRVLAFKGEDVAAEVTAARRVLDRLGAGQVEVLTIGAGLVAVPTTVLSIPRVR